MIRDCSPSTRVSVYVRLIPMRSKLLCVTMSASQSPLAILAVRCLRRSLAMSSLEAMSSRALGELLKFPRELLQQMMGDGDEGFLGDTVSLEFHRRRHHVGFSGADTMGQQRAARTLHPPDRIFLMRRQGK